MCKEVLVGHDFSRRFSSCLVISRFVVAVISLWLALRSHPIRQFPARRRTVEAAECAINSGMRSLFLQRPAPGDRHLRVRAPMQYCPIH